MKQSLRFLLSLAALFLLAGHIHSQTVYTFTNAGATGEDGPTQTDVNTAYSGTNLAGNVTVGTGSMAGIQQWTVPVSGFYKIRAIGAQGGGANGGLGASMEGEFLLVQNQTLLIIVGQEGVTETGQPNSVGGGGGSFVVRSPGTTTGQILVIAGGGGGSPSSSYPAVCNAVTGTSGNSGQIDGGVANPDGAGGTGGNGGNKSVSTCSLDRGAGGGGFLTGGGSICQTAGRADGGSAFISGGAGGSINSTGAEGGFGGGGAAWSTGFRGSGGGGGYSGGGAGQINSNSPNHAGGGGGSFNSGSSQNNIAATNSGNGSVIIEKLPGPPNDAGITQLIEPISNCVGNYQVRAEVSNLGSSQIDSVDIEWSINGVTQTPFKLVQLLDTAAGTGQWRDTVLLGNITLAATTYSIKVWTSNPNNMPDAENQNDTLLSNIQGFPFPLVDLGLDTAICPLEIGALTSKSAVVYDSLRWNNNATTDTIFVNATGMYSIQVYQNGCESRDTIMVSHHPPAPSIDFGPDTSICSNDSLVLDATRPGVTYLWQNSTTMPTQTVKSAGTYSVVIEDANTCNSGDTIRVRIFPEPTVTHAVVPGNIVCFGTPVTFTAFGSSEGSIMYQWKVNNMNSGPQTAMNTFSPTLDNGDSVSVDLITDLCANGGTRAIPSNVINMVINPPARSINGPDTILENSSAIYAVGVSSGTYSWSVTGGTINGNSNGNSISVDWGAATSGKVICEETVSGCTFPNELDVRVVSIVGVNENAEITMGQAYPNPASTVMTIPLNSSKPMNIELNLFDITGKKAKSVYQGEVNGNQNISFEVDDLENGIYFYRMVSSDGYETVGKILIQH